MTRGDQAAEIAQALRTDIISGRLAAGTALRQEQLASRFDVSRIPVREALNRLAAEGLVQLKPNRGATVAPLSVDDLTEIYEMRIAAETLALRTALPHLTNAQLEIASGLQDELEKAPISQFGALNTQFHMALYRPCARPRLLSHIKTLGHAADRYLRIGAGSLGHAAQSHREHRELLSASAERDEEAALTCLNWHIKRAADMLIDRLSQSTLS
ncbi:MAG: GntR family transcriptional regulator [Pseudomonadota bacterium]